MKKYMYRFSLGLALSALLCLFVACADQTKSTKTTQTSSSSATTTASSELFQGKLVDVKLPILQDTRGKEKKEKTITTINGDKVTYNQHTRKIVVVSGSQDVVAFGIQPLAYEGTSDIRGYENFYGQAQALQNSTPFSTEEILSYEPELILVNQKMSQTNIKALSKIAPVIPLYTDSTDFATRLNYIGEIFGLPEHAKTLTRYAQQLKQAMLNEIQTLNIKGKTLTIYTYFGELSIPPERGWFMNSILYDDLGIARKKNVKQFMRDESGVAYAAISAEKLKEYEGDMVLFASFDGYGIPSYVSDNVGWQSLKAVQENRVGIIDITPYAQKGVILLEQQYRQLYEALKVASQ